MLALLKAFVSLFEKFETLKKIYFYLKSIKVNVFQVFVFSSIIVGSFYLYKVGKPMYHNVTEIPSIKSDINTIKQNTTISSKPDTSFNYLIRKIDDLNSNVNDLNCNMRKIDKKLDVVKEEVPKLGKRFDDIESGWNAQYDDLKKNLELSQIFEN